jgi:hypothetical protein
MKQKCWSFLTCICLSARYFVWPWAPYHTAHVTSHRGHCPLLVRISCITWRISKLLETLTFLCVMLHILLLCVLFFTRIGCTLLMCDRYMSDLRHIDDPVLSSLKMEGIRLLLQIFFCTTLGRKQLSAGRNLRLPCMFRTFICCTSDRYPVSIIRQFRAVANAVRPYVSEICRFCPLWSEAMQFLTDVRTLRRILLHPSSGYPETRHTSTRLHGVTSQNTSFIILNFLHALPTSISYFPEIPHHVTFYLHPHIVATF